MNFLFAWRYFKSRKSTNAINIIAWISVLAIVVGTTSLIVLLSVFNGFEDLVKSLYASFYTDLRVSPERSKSFKLTADQLKAFKALPEVANYSMVIEEKALMQNGDKPSIVYLKGVDDSYQKITGIADHLRRGNFNTGTEDKPLAILGVGIENALEVESDRALLPISVYLPRKNVNISSLDPLQALSEDNIGTAGSFAIQQDFDNKYAITNIGFMKRMLNYANNEYSAIEIQVKDASSIPLLKIKLARLLGSGVVIQTRYEQNQNLYNIMQTEKWVFYGLLAMILVVAAFTMIGALTMLVLEKQKDIQILKAIGSDEQRIQKIFLGEGFLLASIGGIAGTGLALLICWLQVHYHLVALQGGTFVIEYYPVKVSFTDILIVLGTVILVAFAASWFPARKASVQPIALRS